MSDFFDNRAGRWDSSQYRISRTGQIAEKLKQQIPLPRNSSLLDFGCGTGLFGFCFAEQVDSITFADTSEGMLKKVREKIEKAGYRHCKTVNVDIIPLTGTYYLILSLLALHHIEDLSGTVVNLINHTEKKGYICLCDMDPEDGSFHYPETVPHNGIERSVLIDLLEKNGCRILFNETVHTNEKLVGEIHRTYPVFMLIGQKIT
jgi:2-polyprenyl-3-methyl-5-hydroxy-6-metoxy-1,4-benzoquinol methylase